MDRPENVYFAMPSTDRADFVSRPPSVSAVIGTYSASPARQGNWAWICPLSSLTRFDAFAILLYGLEALPLNKSQLASLDFVVNRFFMKLFKTTGMQVVEVCREQFDLVLPSMQIDRRRKLC